MLYQEAGVRRIGGNAALYCRIAIQIANIYVDYATLIGAE